MRVLEDEHLAHRNAECMKEREMAREHEYDQNGRADGRQWAHVVRANQYGHAAHR